MREGDKLVCIKDLIKFISDPVINKEENDVYVKHRNGEITTKEFKKLTINLFKKKDKSLQDRVTFSKGKIYTIDHVNDSSIDILSDFNKIENFSILEDGRLSILARYHYDDHFITLIEARKKKLDDLSDENFNEFLKRIKVI